MPSFISKGSKIKIMNFIQNIHILSFLKNIVYRSLIVPSELIALNRLKKIINNYSYDEDKKEKVSKKIVFNSVDAKYTGLTYMSIILAKALQMRSHEIKMLLCNSVLKSCAGHFTVDKKPSKWECTNCKFFSKKIYEIVKIPYSTYDEYIKDKEIADIEKKIDQLSIEECKKYIYKKVRVGFHASNSVKRYFKGGIPPKETYNKILKIELTNAIISAELAEKVFKKEKPDIIISSHTCYSSWGSFAEYFNNKKIRIISWSSSENKLTFETGDINENFNQYYEKYRNKTPLDEKEEKQLREFIDKRFKGEEGQVSLYGFKEKKNEEIKSKFHFDKYKKTYVIFPNVPWDASLLNADKAFTDVYDWLSYTINIFIDKPSYQLIVKIHPSEIRVMGSKKTVLDYINSNHKNLPENIHIIPSNTDISAYSLFPFIDVGLVYNGTLGLEMAINKIPVVAAGISHYIRKGFTYDVSTKEEYKKLLLGEIEKPSEKMVEYGKVYAYYYFLKKAIPHKFMMYYNNFLDIGWSFNSLNELKQGKNKYIDLICNYIINGGIYQDWEIKEQL